MVELRSDEASQSGPVPSHCNVRCGSTTDLTALKPDFRFTPESRLRADIAPCPFRANNGSRAYSIISSQRASIFLRWSFGQPGLPQSFFVSREIVGPPRAQHVFEIGNTQRG